jgi:Arc/MetJ-type ribon-helix-helix transcriptional regulator
MADTEKITVNLNVVDLGKIDMLVDEGFYTNRADFLRTAIRNETKQHSEQIDQITKTKNYFVGVVNVTADTLANHYRKEKMMDIKAIGVLTINPGVTVEMAEKTIASVKVWGKIFMPPDVRERLEELGRIHS